MNKYNPALKARLGFTSYVTYKTKGEVWVEAKVKVSDNSLNKIIRIKSNCVPGEDPSEKEKHRIGILLKKKLIRYKIKIGALDMRHMKRITVALGWQLGGMFAYVKGAIWIGLPMFNITINIQPFPMGLFQFKNNLKF